MDAKTLIESFKKDLTCFICMGYLNEPVLVKCGHSFCKECLRSCWKEDQEPIRCPTCKESIKFGDFSYNRKLQDLSIIGKMLRPHLLQSIKDLTTCDRHGKEETLFCVEDHRPLCGPCFLSGQHEGHTVLPLEKAACQCMAKLQTAWDILKRKKQEFKIKLELEKIREEEYEVDLYILKAMMVSEDEEMKQFFIEERRFHLKSLDREARNKLEEKKSRAGQFQDNISLPMNSEHQPVEMLEMEDQCMKQSSKCEFEKKPQFFSNERQLDLERVYLQIKENLAKFEERTAKMTQEIHNLEMAMSEIENEFEKLPIEILLDSKGMLERYEVLLLQNPVVFQDA